MGKFITKTLFLFIFFISLSFQNSITQIHFPSSKTHKAMKSQDVSKDLKITSDYGKIPLYFIPNEGQVSEQALFYAKASRYMLWLTKEGLVFDSTRRIEKKKIETQPLDIRERKNNEDVKYWRDVSRMRFLNTNKTPDIVPENQTEHKVNYFIGNDESKWRTNLQTSQAILYKELYENIDLKVYGVEKEIEYDWVVRRGGDVEKIRFEYRNIEETRIDAEGDLVVKTECGELKHKRPMGYQVIKGEKIEVNVEFMNVGNNTYGFHAKTYDRDYELIIDPVILAYSTYLGGSEYDYGISIAVDTSGNAYVTGDTLSTDFPTVNPYMTKQSDFDNHDVFVSKLSTTGNSLVYSTYLGGNGGDYNNSIAVDTSGCAYLTGGTWSTDFPTVNPYMTDPDGNSLDAFVTKLAAAGNSLVYSTYLGGNATDWGYAIAIDAGGNAYVTGDTLSTDFPTVNPYMTDPDGNSVDAFVTKLAAAGNSLVYSTYLGGNAIDWGYAIAIDASGNAYVTGSTTSTDFPTVNPYMTDPGDNSNDAFVTKLAAAGNSLVYSTYLGGSGIEGEYGEIAIDATGCVYVTGYTFSTDFPTVNPYMTDPGDNSNDAFVTKLAAAGNSLVYSTYLGGSGGDYGDSIAVDAGGNAYVTGSTTSTDFPTVNPYMTDPGDNSNDAFVTKLAAAGNRLVYSTYLGGNAFEWGQSIAINAGGNAYVTGMTQSTDFPTVNPYMTDPGDGEADVFVTKLFSHSCYIFDGHDFDGNGTSDISLFRPTYGMWYIKDGASQQWGAPGDIPTQGNYDLDADTEIAVWRPSDGLWYISGISTTQWGAYGDIPVPHDYNGDDITDLAVWRPSDGVWYINGLGYYQWGQQGDYPVPGDYNGDGVDEIAVWRPAEGTWYISGVGYYQWGTEGDIPVPADYNGDGMIDLAVFRPAHGIWYIQYMGGGTVAIQWGMVGDVAVPGDYDGNGTTEVAIWRPSDGLWYIYGNGTYQWGTSGDIPLVR